MSGNQDKVHQPTEQSDRFASNFKGIESNEVLVAEIWNICNVKPGYMTPKEQAAADARKQELLNEWRKRTNGGTLQTALAYYKKVYNTPRH